MTEPSGCACAETLAETLGGYVVQRSGHDQLNWTTCFWCGDPLAEPESSDRFRTSEHLKEQWPPPLAGYEIERRRGVGL